MVGAALFLLLAPGRYWKAGDFSTATPPALADLEARVRQGEGPPGGRMIALLYSHPNVYVDVAQEDAPFRTGDQKRDILYNNAARFLRLTREEIARHHGA